MASTTTFTGVVRSENGFSDITKTASTGAITTNSTYGTNADIGGTLDVTGVTKLAGATNLVTPYVSLTAATSAPTAAQSGTTFVFNRAAGVVVTLPVAAVGIRYKFIVGTTVTSNVLSIKGSSATNGFTAYSMVSVKDKDNNVTQDKIFLADGSDDDVFSMNGGTTGGFLGSVIDVLGVAAGGASFAAVWHLNSDLLIADGTLATPFA